MIKAPEFALYPEIQPPAYSRWIASGAALCALAVGTSVLLRTFIEVRSAVAGTILVLLIWLLALLIRVVFYRANQHNARCFAISAAQVKRAWWARHRQTVALVEAVLLGPTCSAPAHRGRFFDPDHQPALVQEMPEGTVIRLRQIFGRETGERERQLAIFLALQWREQRGGDPLANPLRCYWQGSANAWQAFVTEMKKLYPEVSLPELPEPWQGISSLDEIIDLLQGASADTCILCAGVQSVPPESDRRLPGGEAAVLWLLGSQSGVRFLRGEWFSADTDELAKVVERAQQQGSLEASTPLCVSFSQADIPVIRWNLKQNAQDAHFGALAGLEAMVLQTLAAWYAEQHGVPCAWLASDPHHSLALGIVKFDDSSS